MLTNHTSYLFGADGFGKDGRDRKGQSRDEQLGKAKDRKIEAVHQGLVHQRPCRGYVRGGEIVFFHPTMPDQKVHLISLMLICKRSPNNASFVFNKKKHRV